MTVCKQNIFDEITGQYTTIDNREFLRCVQLQLEFIRNRARDLIIEVAPEYKQRNAALGLLSDTEIVEIKNNIQTIRNISNEKENNITSVVWDGTEETRAAACDAVQAVRWE